MVSAPPGRRQGQDHGLIAPLDVDIADRGRAKASVARKSAPRTNTSMGAGSLRESRHAPCARSCARNVPGKLRRMFGFIASSYAGWKGLIEITPGTGM